MAGPVSRAASASGGSRRLLSAACCGLLLAAVPLSAAAGGGGSSPQGLRWRSPATGKVLPLRVFPAADGAARDTVIYLERLAGPVGRSLVEPGRIRELTAGGCRVCTVDYAGDPRARPPWLNADFLAMRSELPALIGAGDLGRVFILPAGYRLIRDVVYFEAPGHRFAMDIWLPPAPEDGRVPCAVQFAHNNAERMAARNFIQYHDSIIDGLAALGFAVAMADHPMAPPAVSTYDMPGVVYRARAAVRTLRAQVAQAGLRPGGVGAIGFSRAGAIAAFLAVAGTRQIPGDAGPHREYPETVQAALCGSGRYDLLAALAARGGIGDRSRLIQAWGDPARHPDAWRRASPITYVSAGDPPIFLTVGSADRPFRVAQARAMFGALAAAGVVRRLVIEGGMGHALPSDPATIRAIDGFLLSRVKPPAAPSPPDSASAS